MNSLQYEQRIAELEELNKEREALLEKVFAAEKFLGTVISGPMMREKTAWYRIKVGQGDKLASYAATGMFGEDGPIEKDTEVIIAGDAIIAVLPKPLLIEKPKISMTKLIEWDQIGGMKSQINKIRAAVEGPMKNKKLAEELGVTPIKGILLYGPPGCGKTLIGKAIARTILNEAEVEPEAFVYMKGAEVLAPLVGVAEERIRLAFASARKYSERTGKRAVLFIDEAEAILPMRGSRQSSDVDSTIVPAFLAEMDGFDDNGPIVLLATNRPELMDNAAIRPGRVDLKIGIDYPTREDVKDIFDIHAKKVKFYDNYEEIRTAAIGVLYTEQTKDRVSGSLVEALIKIATTNALARRMADKTANFGITEEDIKESYKSVKDGV